MTFTPARMSRILVGGHKSRLEEAIEALHGAGVVHIEDYQDPLGITGIGTPLEAGDEASALLVRLRGMQKALGAEGVAPVPTEEAPSAILAEAEAAATPAIERLRSLREAWARAEGDESALRPLSGIEADVGHAAGLRSVRVLVGVTRSDPSAAVARTGVTHDLQVASSGSGYAVVAIAPAAQAAPVERALSESGFTPVQVPPGSGTPRERLATLEGEKARLESEIDQAESQVAALRDAWAPRLAAAEAALSHVVEKTQAPLHFGVTETTFHVEGWVPQGQVEDVEEALLARFGDQVYFHALGDVPPLDGHGGGPAHGHGEPSDHHGHAHDAPAENGHDEAHDEHDPSHDPPVHLENPKPAKPYEWILGLLARPRYQEIDPTKLMLLFFPLFFGLMVGDVVVGLLIVAFGLFLRNHKVIGIGGPAVGKAIVAGGIVSILVGLFVFGEALGIHFVVSPEGEAEGEMSWENLLGLHIPFEGDANRGLLYKTGSAAGHGGVAGAADGMTTHAEGTEEAHGILSPHSNVHLSVAGLVNLGYYSKIHDVQPLLIWSLLIALVHIDLGLLIGFRNVRRAHGTLLAIQEKGAWLTLQVGGAMALLSWLGRPAEGLTTTGWVVFGAGLGLTTVSLVWLWQGAAKVMGMGMVSILEIPSLLGNFVSYTRLAAIGASKAGLGLALAVISFDTIGGGNQHSVVGWLVYVVGFLGITALAVLTGSLQSLRLQFVEFFGKFFTGGGRPYVPFGRRAA
jgi:V/A-type H+/Na+-transporting ATPase subunit I